MIEPRQLPAATRALAWLRANELPSGGIRVSAEVPRAYPEVSGYLIPTLREYGEHELARRTLQWLLGVQAADGSFADPDEGKPRVFDSGQVLRGLLFEATRTDAAREAARKCAAWLVAQMVEGGARGYAPQYGGDIPETVLLYTLAPLRAAAAMFGEPSWAEAASRSVEHYLQHPHLMQATTITHFLAYEIEALQELGRGDAATARLAQLAREQGPDGAIAAKPGAEWICTPGQAQIAICWLNAGMDEPAQKALQWLERNQGPNGGFEGSVGGGAAYFAGREISWAVKFYLDAQRKHVTRFMEKLEHAFSDSIAESDGRFKAVLGACAPHSRVLEAGCGKGRFLRALKERMPLELTGSDIAPSLLKYVGPGVRTVVAPTENLPFPDGQFDTIFSVEAIEHSPNVPAAVAEMARVLKPGGTLLIIDKQAAHAGAMATPSWERWPGAEELRGQLARHCDQVSVEPVSYDGRDDGVMLAWRGRKALPAQTVKRVLVICEDALGDLARIGWSGETASRYFNPANVAEKVFILQWPGDDEPWPGLAHERVVMPRDPALEAWRVAAQIDPPDANADAALFSERFPGIPVVWLAKLAALKVDCVRAYAPRVSGWLAVEVARQLRVPALVSVHNVRGLTESVLRRADALMCVSEAVAAACIERGAEPSRVATVFNRVDRAVFTPDGLPAQAAPAGEPRLLCVARDAAQKNIDRLLEACERVHKRHPGLVLVHAGKSTRDWSRWPFVTHFDAIANHELPAWYRWAQWFVLTSQWEGFGIALAEALSCGTPCITSNRAPMTEIVREGECGLLCDPDSVESIEATLEHAIMTAGLRDGLSAKARAASEPYEIERIERREAELYRWCVGCNRPMVSVVLPTFNRCRLVEAAVRNVLSQDYANLELIVVNDGSSDGTEEFLDGLKNELNDSRLRIIHKPNGGLPNALNTGFAQAKGDYFAWTSDDNAYRPGAISAMVRELELDHDAVMVFADYREIREDGTPGNVKTTGPASDLNRRNTVGACFLYRREAARQVGEYDAKLELAEDYDYWVRLAKVGKLVHLSRTLYDYGDSPDSLSRLRATGVAEAAAKIVERQGSPQAVHDHMVTLAGEYKRHGQPLRSLGVSLSLIARYPLSRAGYWAAARALTPMPLLRMTRRMRGLDGRA